MSNIGSCLCNQENFYISLNENYLLLSLQFMAKTNGYGSECGTFVEESFLYKVKTCMGRLANAHESFECLPVIKEFLKYFE